MERAAARVPVRRPRLRVLLVSSAFNSLTQRVFTQLGELGHAVLVELAVDGDSIRRAVACHSPQLVIAPMLKSAIPRDVWREHTCLIVHPGPVGDRGPSSLDWAVTEGLERWGVTVLQAGAVMDAGDVWASQECPVPPVGKSDLYRNEISDAAVAAVLRAVERFSAGRHAPEPQDHATSRARPPMPQDARRIDWSADPAAVVLRKLRGADSRPGVRDVLLGRTWFLHGGHPEDELRGAPGQILATRSGAICRATADGAVWIPELRARRAPGGPPTCKLPATLALGGLLRGVPEVPAPLMLGAHRSTWADIAYFERGDVGMLRFSFPGGAMGTEHCRRLLAAYKHACSRPTCVLLLGGARDFFSNGIHLNVIEAAADPAAESWANINAIDDLVQAVLTTTDRLVVAAPGGNASAGGAMLALAADEVWCRAGTVLNPHYRLMGLPGSEYWTHTLPARAGTHEARRLTERALPVGADAARRLGLVERVVHAAPDGFGDEVLRLAARLAASPGTQQRVAEKKARLERQAATAPLSGFRQRELARMHDAFFDPRSGYHALRSAFVRKDAPGGTPAHLIEHNATLPFPAGL